MFCNVVATSNREDFHTLELVTEQLNGLVEFSSSIARLRALFKAFVGLCKDLVKEPAAGNTTFASDEAYTPQTTQARDYTVTSHPPLSLYDEGAHSSEAGFYALSHQASSNLPTPLEVTDYPSGDNTGFADPGWGLFEVHPTLDWLEADFSIFNSNQ